MAKRKIYLDEISVDYGDVNSNPYFNQQNYAKVEEPKKKVNNSYKPSKTTKNSSVGSGEYAVQKGDSLWKIAKEHGTTVEALRAANPEIKGNMIYPNQIINLGTNTKIPNVKIVVDKIIDNNVTDNKRQSFKPTTTSSSSTATQSAPVNKPTTKQINKPAIKNESKRFRLSDHEIAYVPNPVEQDAANKAYGLSYNIYNLTGQDRYQELYHMYLNPKRSNKQSNTKSTKNANQIRRDNIVKRTNERQEQVHKYDRKFTLKDIKPKISQKSSIKTSSYNS